MFGLEDVMDAMVRTISATLLMLASLLGCNGPDGWPSEPFDAREWADTPEVKRYVFARDLIDRKLLHGKTPAEVTTLLGPPSSENLPEHAMTYVISSGGIGFNQIFVLDVRFDPAAGRVERVVIRGD
jgi:hypothetical protein